MSDTNKILLTVDDIFRMQGRQRGFDPSDLEYEQANKTAEDLNRDKLKAMMAPEQAMPSYITLTNAADKSEIRGVMEDGKFRQIPVDKLTTPSGTFAMTTATNTAPIFLPDGSVAQNYTGDPMMSGMPQPGIGGAGMAVTNAPAAAPTQTPAPSPTPQFTEGQRVRQNGITYVFTNGQFVPTQ